MQQQTHAQKWNEHWTKSCFAKDNSIFQLDERSELRLVKLLDLKNPLQIRFLRERSKPSLFNSSLSVTGVAPLASEASSVSQTF